MIAWVMPALYPAKPWTLGDPSNSGQLEKCGIGLSLRFLGEKPIEPWRGLCSFGIRRSSREGHLSADAKRHWALRATVTMPAGPERSGPRFRDPRGIARGVVWLARLPSQ